MQETYIHGFKVKYEDNAKEGAKHLLYDLDREESKVFFDQAKAKRAIKFEDDEDRNYNLSYNNDRTYTLIRKI